MRFNMGCGHNRQPGFVNVDASAECAPDQVWDLEQTPWPWPDGCASEVRFIHSLEHMGGDPNVFLAIMRELYRIAAPDCLVLIHVPHPRHDDFMNDPTHVRPITPQVMSLFNRELNDRWQEAKVANSPLAHYTGTDFRMIEALTVLDEPYHGRLAAGEMTEADVREAIRSRNNVVREFRIKLQARKSVEAVPVDGDGAVSAGA